MKAIDLFCAAGGLSLGMKAAGIIPQLCVELNRDAMDSYATHSPECAHINSDIQQVSFSRLRGKIDIVFGGPPCQPFSLGGLRKGQDDARDMIPEFIRCLSDVQPEAFVMENVPGLIMTDARAYFDSVLHRLSELGYVLNWAVLNAADYGVPQKRKRLFILGSKRLLLKFPFPTHGEQGVVPHRKSSEFIGSEPIGEPPSTPVKFAANPDLRKSPYAGHVYNGGGRPIDPNGPCHTILASSGGHKTHWVDTLGVAPEYHAHLLAGGAPKSGVVPGARRLSVEECAIIQTFPRDMEFKGSRSSRYKQIGDAVPPLLAQAIAEAVFLQMNGDDTSKRYLDVSPSPGIWQQNLLI